ncbi:MAG: GNAT family N-acetyltransferase [Granulosicoccaceae bacterium]
MLRVERLSGEALSPYVDDIARLRLQIFRDFPYLYNGDMEYERRYLKTYLDSELAAVILARDGSSVVGASTCLPLRDEEASFKEPLSQLGMDTDRMFYLAESVLDPHYRGKGIGLRFFQERETYAKLLGGFSHACFCAVQRPLDHPLRPASYTPLDAFWRKRGYAPIEASAKYTWLDVAQATETEKQLQFWIKKL